MAYTDFTLYDLRQQFGAHFRAEMLFPNAAAVEPSDWLMQALRMGEGIGFNSEKSRSERLVTPVLLELRERNNRSFSIYSGLSLDVNPTLGLRGECDFIFSYSRIQDFIAAPVFLVLQVHYRESEDELAPLFQQLIAARHLNEQEKNPICTLYGCSTTGVEWRFLKYEDNEFILDEQRYYLAQLPALLGALQAVVDATRAGVA